MGTEERINYDHLDFESVVEVNKWFPEARFFVPLGQLMRVESEIYTDALVVGVKSWFGATGIPIERVQEMDWWDSVPFDLLGTREGDTGEIGGGLRVSCVPAQHNSGMSPSLSALNEGIDSVCKVAGSMISALRYGVVGFSK